MYTVASKFIRRNKKQILITSGLAASTYYIYTLIYCRFIKSAHIDHRKKADLENATKEELKKRFEKTQLDAIYKLLDSLPSLCDNIMENISVESITHELQIIRIERKKRSVANGLRTGDDGDDTISVKSLGSEMTSFSMIDSLKSIGNSSVGSSMISKKNKIQLWEELKIESITRIISQIYATALLVFFTRVQYNIIGRQQYAEYILEGLNNTGSSKEGQRRVHTSSSTESIEHQIINEQYLLFNWWLVNRGWGGIVKGVRNSVQQVFHGINPRQELSFQNVYDLIKRVQSLMDYPSLPGHQDKKRYSSFLLPPKELETFIIAQGMGVADIYEPNGANGKTFQGVSDSVPDIYPELQIHDYLRSLLDQTSELIKSSSAIKVIGDLISSGLDVFLAQVADGSYKFNDIDNSPTDNSETTGENRASDIQVDTEKKVKLASLLAIASKQSYIISRNVSNQYLEVMDGSPDLNALCAMIFSNVNID